MYHNVIQRSIFLALSPSEVQPYRLTIFLRKQKAAFLYIKIVELLGKLHVLQAICFERFHLASFVQAYRFGTVPFFLDAQIDFGETAKAHAPAGLLFYLFKQIYALP